MISRCRCSFPLAHLPVTIYNCSIVKDNRISASYNVSPVSITTAPCGCASPPAWILPRYHIGTFGRGSCQMRSHLTTRKTITHLRQDSLPLKPHDSQPHLIWERGKGGEAVSQAVSGPRQFGKTSGRFESIRFCRRRQTCRNRLISRTPTVTAQPMSSWTSGRTSRHFCSCFVMSRYPARITLSRYK